MKKMINHLAFLIAISISVIMPENVINSSSQQENKNETVLLTFGLIADIQYCDCEPAGSRYYRSSLQKLADAMRSFKSDNPAFIITLGDMIDRDYSSYAPVYKILDTSRLKVYHITGNHDYAVEPGLRKEIPPLKENKAGYYSFTRSNFRFIFLNGNEISTYASVSEAEKKEAGDYLLRLKNSGEINANPWNGGISDKQVLWLSEQLNSAERNGEKVFIFCHFPVFPEKEHNLLNYKDILTVLEGHKNIIAWFAGHNHAGSYGNFNMIHFVTMRGMVETEATSSYALVEVYKNKIWIKGSGREKSQILAY
jgi:manganese-dependent ADP-ribose/CDP-alcohol diphosphatase